LDSTPTLSNSSVLIRRHPTSPLFPYTTLFRSRRRTDRARSFGAGKARGPARASVAQRARPRHRVARGSHQSRKARNGRDFAQGRSEEHTSDSSHQIISYAVFCLKKKKQQRTLD